MANVQVIQRHAHLVGAVRLEIVNGREGRIAKGVLTAISNLGKGSHVNIVGRLRNNNYEKDGEEV